MDAKYFFGINNEKVGPLDEKSIQQRINQGTITQDTPAWTSGMADWQPVVNIAELKSAFGELLLKQAVPPPLPTSVHSTAQATPPPLPQKSAANPSAPSEGIPAGLSQFEASCYKFDMWCYRPMGKWQPPMRKMVVDSPKKAVPVALGTAAAMVFMMIFVLSSFSQTGKQTGAPGQAGVSQTQQPAGDWQAQYQAIRGAQQYGDNVIDDVYKYKRDSQDRQDETYRRANYDWYKSDDK
jgi:hypothetical protein